MLNLKLFSVCSINWEFVVFIVVGHFRQFDYRKAENIKQYGKVTPPDYDLSKVTSAGYLIYANGDNIADSEVDVPKLCSSLGNCIEKILLPIPFNHIDFIASSSAPKLTYTTVIQLLSQH